MPDAIQGFLTSTGDTSLDWRAFAVSFLVAAALALVLEQFYIRNSRSLSNRRAFAANFVYVTLTTMLVISVVKTSVALSLGLVGALSIVRFRAAIKEPEELAYLFLAIAIGLGAGASQIKLTVSTVAGILLVVMLRNLATGASGSKPALYLTVRSSKRDLSVGDILGVLREHCSSADLQRSDESDAGVELAFTVEFAGEGKYLAAREALGKLDDQMTVSFVDVSGI
jgi:uncharacterized membrane protein YhiD involved in acid resistance